MPSVFLTNFNRTPLNKTLVVKFLKSPKPPSLSALVSDLRRQLVELAKSEASQYGEAKAKSVIGKLMGNIPSSVLPRKKL